MLKIQNFENIGFPFQPISYINNHKLALMLKDFFQITVVDCSYTIVGSVTESLSTCLPIGYNLQSCVRGFNPKSSSCISSFFISNKKLPNIITYWIIFTKFGLLLSQTIQDRVYRNCTRKGNRWQPKQKLQGYQHPSQIRRRAIIIKSITIWRKQFIQTTKGYRPNSSTRT